MADYVSTFAAARRMCERSDWTLTNLELQKMLYLAQMMFMGTHDGERLLNGAFEAWDYGPVIPVLYSQVKSFGSAPIKDIFFGVGEVKDQDRAKMLDDAYDQLSPKTAGQLVSITHWNKGAWAKHYRQGALGITIPDADILQEYRDRANG